MDTRSIAGPASSSPWCDACPLSRLEAFERFSGPELAFMRSFKQEHARAWAGETILRQGDRRPRLFTLFSGWAVKHRTLPAGERQILSMVLPGDLIGLESVLFGVAEHAVEAVTDITLCRFDHRRLGELLAIPSLAERLLRLIAFDQRRLEQRFAFVAACDARRNLAFLMVDLHSRLHRRRTIRGHSFRMPLSKRQIADALGITTVHVHRVLRGLHQEEILTIENGIARIHDLDRLHEAACTGEDIAQERPIL